ncbi:MAG: hypothetical protein RJB03_941, partial [Bacteroidota bacterium]
LIIRGSLVQAQVGPQKETVMNNKFMAVFFIDGQKGLN